jgi:hypothetical protein
VKPSVICITFIPIYGLAAALCRGIGLGPSGITSL